MQGVTVTSLSTEAAVFGCTTFWPWTVTNTFTRFKLSMTCRMFPTTTSPDPDLLASLADDGEVEAQEEIKTIAFGFGIDVAPFETWQDAVEAILDAFQRSKMRCRDDPRHHQ